MIQVEKLTRRLKQESIINFIIPRFESILFIAIFLGVIGLGPRLLNVDGDLGRHLTIGTFILDNLTIPTRDIFSHTMEGMRLTPHEWLAQVIYALSYRLAGLDGVVIFCALLIASTFTLVFKQCMQQSKVLLLSLGITILAAAAASLHWLARPHLFTLLFTVLWLGEMEIIRRTGRIRWLVLVLLMIAWVNFHGAFIVGFVIMGAYLIEFLISTRDNPSIQISLPNERFGSGRFTSHKFIWLGILVFGVTFLNPAGYHIWETTFGFLSNRYLVSHTAEYLPPDFQSSYTWPFLFLIFITILFSSINSKKLTIASTILISSWTVMALISARNIPLFAVIAAPILARSGAKILEDNTAFQRFKNYDNQLCRVDKQYKGYLWPIIFMMLVGAVLLGGGKLDFTRDGNEFSGDVFPVEAANWLDHNPIVGPVFNYFPWGGYLLYRNWPDQAVFIDGQTDFYGESLTRQYEQVISLSDGWEDILTQYNIKWALMPSNSLLAQTLIGHSNWDLLYKDQTAAVLFKNP